MPFDNFSGSVREVGVEGGQVRGDDAHGAGAVVVAGVAAGVDAAGLACIAPQTSGIEASLTA